ncbi:hypothetical protein RvY_12340 [Ramazzottius varieornatus]|uniref:Uncharacterized protein n=1 Tax=Ramazzottius varieornatus TaxID=947166 RepID=A0A1D1VJ65_RAMVA|nr:hypothetical protein RvY_12340 [Ramazzottius varieornatus]
MPASRWNLRGLRISQFNRQYRSTRSVDKMYQPFDLIISDHDYRHYVHRRILNSEQGKHQWELTPEQKERLLDPNAEVTPALMMDWLFYNPISHRRNRVFGPYNILPEVPESMLSEFRQWQRIKITDEIHSACWLEDYRLATNGFYFDPQHNTAQCNYCRTKMVNSIDEEIPAKHKQSCDYLFVYWLCEIWNMLYATK